MVRIGRIARVAVGAVIIVAVALVVYRRIGTPPSVLRNLNTVAPGAYAGLPPGIAAVRGECGDKLALTPAASHYLGATTAPYPLVYDCATKTFTVLKSRPNPTFAADLTLTREGYYLHETRFVNGIET